MKLTLYHEQSPSASETSTPVIDERLLLVKEKLKLSDDDIKGFWKSFQNLVDTQVSDFVDISLICEHIRERRTILMDAVFELGGAEPEESLEPEQDSTTPILSVRFGNFVHGICSFVMLRTGLDMCKFIFFLVDKEKRGYVTTEALESIMTLLHSSGNHMSRKEVTVPKYTLNALRSQTYEGDLISFEEFKTLCTSYPSLLFPIFRLQQKLCSRFMGEPWWERKKSVLYKSKMQQIYEQQQKIAKEEQHLRKKQISQIKAEIGLIGYLLNVEKRRELEALNPLPHVFLNENGDIQYADKDQYKRIREVR